MDPDIDPAYARQLHARPSLVMTYAALTPIVLLTLPSRPENGWQLQHIGGGGVRRFELTLHLQP
jgi:hypothetical protein